jgi:hypothetical protein
MAGLRLERGKWKAAMELYPNRPVREFSKALQNWWKAIEAALTVYRRALANGRALLPPPLAILDVYSNVAGYLAIGQIPGIVAHGERVIIVDKKPIRTVCEAFGIKRSTAHGWKQKVPPAFPDVGPIDGDILESFMRQAGERYQREGRSASAITKRCPCN